MAKHDVIYVLKNNYTDEELRYSVRSVVQNFQYRKLVFVGGCPEYMTADIVIPHKQEGASKWKRSMGSLKKALSDNRLTEDVWLFNDDFFVMDRHSDDINYFNGTLEKRIIDLKKANPRGSTYISGLDNLRGNLMFYGKDTLSFALHVPFLINRAKALAIFEKPGSDMFRSYYGNFYEIECRYMKDVKVYDQETIPDTSFISTSDEAFKTGKVGTFLRKYFSEPSKYEKDRKFETRELYDEDGEVRYE